MDGARAGNAAVGLAVSLAQVCASVDSASICLSKGLGAPVGSVVVGDAGFVKRVKRARKALGGAWRQAGVLAAAGLVALDTMHETLARDHALAREFAREVTRRVPNARLAHDRAPATNMVFFTIEPRAGSARTRAETVEEFERRVAAHGLLVGAGYGPRGDLIRAVMHRDVGEKEILGRGVDLCVEAARDL